MDVLADIFGVVFMYYIARWLILVCISISILMHVEYKWFDCTFMPPLQTFFLEPFNYHNYTFFKTKEEYERYLEAKEIKKKAPSRMWWKDNE